VHLTVNPGVVTLGLIQGLTYGVLAVGLVLAYRTSRVINFAHGNIGAFGAAVCGVLVVRHSVPFWIALPIALLVGGGIGGLTEVVVVRRLRNAPKVMSLVATLGVAAFLLRMSSVVNSEVTSAVQFPQPPGFPKFHIGALLVTRSSSAMLFLSPVVVLALAAFLRYSRYGLALRAAASNPERARLSGVHAARMSTLAWVIAGAVATYTVVLLLPGQGFLTEDVLGPTLLLRALVPAVIARMESLPVALAAGAGVGVVDQVLIYNYPTSGVSELILLGIIVVALLLQAPRSSRREDREDWAALDTTTSRTDAPGARQVQTLGRMVLVAGFAGALAVGLWGSNETAVTLTAMVAFSLLGFSVAILTGLGGQISLGQFAIAGVGATASFYAVDHTSNLLVGVAAGIVAGAAVSAILGIPALRVRGLLLAVISLSFAIVAIRWLLPQSWMLGGGVNPGRPALGPVSLTSTKSYFIYSLVLLALGLWVVGNLWRSGVGRRMRAQRDNDEAARAFAIPTMRVRVQAFVLAGAYAGAAGALYGHLLSQLHSSGFDVTTSTNVIALAVVGGVSAPYGAVLGAMYIIGFPRFFPLDNAELAATSLGWTLLILNFPGGIAQALSGPRQALVAAFARRAERSRPRRARRPVAPPQAAAVAAVRVAPRTRPALPPDTPLLQVEGVSKSYGGIRAVDDVSLSVEQGEVVGIIGPNGAGKTTLFELIGGFNRLDSGRVLLAGEDITALAPEERVRRGLVRSFQNPVLFPTFTVLECLMLALELEVPTATAPSMIGNRRREAAKEAMAGELVGLMGLQQYRHRQIRELSTGTRRIAELACIVALRPTVLLLDEPSSGIAQRESEALGSLLRNVRSYLDTTLLLIEHDIPLLMSLSTRVVAMDTGRVIAAGQPDEVQQNPAVVASYLGSNELALGRSGELAADDRCEARTRSGERCRRRAGEDGVCSTHRERVRA
jgi:ABC-type branched-subunit amino acid transport system ATPase component/branched-subunit amino acid ABC-type transport system permease component